MLLSQTCNHAIRAAIYLATRPPDTYIPVREISEKISVSPHFLTKILQILTALRIMQSFRGPSGGVRLARLAKDIRLIDIVEAIDGRGLFEMCVLGLDGCGEREPCPVHELWGPLRARMERLFEVSTLDVVAADIQKKKLRLANLVLDDPARPEEGD